LIVEVIAARGIGAVQALYPLRALRHPDVGLEKFTEGIVIRLRVQLPVHYCQPGSDRLDLAQQAFKALGFVHTLIATPEALQEDPAFAVGEGFQISPAPRIA